MTDDYPDVPADAAGHGGRIVRILSEWDETHTAKAAILAKVAETEFRLAHKNDEDAIEGHVHFDAFVERSIETVDDALEDNHERSE